MDSSIVGKRRACVNCTAVKAKCNPRPDNTCERCNRLEKTCVYLDLPERKRPSGDSRRVQALEEKVDSLVAHLDLVLRQNATLVNGLSTSLPTPHSPAALSFSPDRNDVGSVVKGFSADIVDRGLLTLEDAKMLLHAFRQHYVPRFPFVAFGADKTVDEVRRESPIFFLSIMAVTESSHPHLQKVLGAELRQQLSLKLMDKKERNLDFLNGLLVYAAWYHYFVDQQNSQLFLLLQLCITVVHDLALEKKMVTSSRGEETAGSETHFNQSFAASDGTRDGKRALLGTYWLSAATSKALRKPCCMRYTKYMNECCQEFTRNSNYATDSLIEPMVQLQNFTNRVAETFGYYDLRLSSVRGDAAVQSVADLFVGELEIMKETFAPHVAADDKAMSMEMYFLVSWIHEVAFHSEFSRTDGGYSAFENPASISSDATALSLRTNMLWRLLHANNNFLVAFLMLPAQDLRYLSFATFSKLCYVLISQAKVAFALLDAWESTQHESLNPQTTGWQFITKQIDYSNYCRQILDKFEVSTKHLSPDERDKSAMFQFWLVTKSMMSSYSTQVKSKIDAKTTFRHRFQATGVQNSENTFSLLPMETAAAPMETANWPDLEMLPEDTGAIFDDATWRTIMNEFMLPL